MEISYLLEKIGYRPAAPDLEAAPVAFRFFNNPDGSVRWLWPADATRPLFLKFYHVAGWKARAFCFITHLLFTLRLQHLHFKKISLQITPPMPQAPIKSESNWALFSGTPGPNRKALVYTETDGRGTFIKIAIGKYAPPLLEQEHNTLQALRLMDVRSFDFPQCHEYPDGVIHLNDISKKEATRANTLTPAHHAALSEIFTRSAKHTTLYSLSAWNKSLSILARLRTSKDPRIPRGMLRKLKMLCDQTADGPITTCLAHGDFTPWNMYLSGQRLSIYDWELSNADLPAGFDACHFVVQNAILVKRQCWRNISDELDTVLNNTPIGIRQDEHRRYRDLYLIINTLYYLNVYAEQPEWHQQVYWLLNTWNDALSAALQGVASHRTLVLMDLFDFIMPRQYATLKFSNELPESLSELSDIDLCIEQKDYLDIKRYLAQHNLIRHHHSACKSFMSNEQVFCTDGSVLSVDLIWKLKRKNLEMLAVAPVIEGAVLNEYGVKTACVIDNARYIALFYALNRSCVPLHYMPHQQHLRGLLSAEDLHLKLFFEHPQDASWLILQDIKRKPANNGISGIRLSMAYLWDVIAHHTRQRGMVITFSGVDGAGKSTIIENLKLRIEKQLRRKTIVLRHRPSILPILSAWTKGKAVAERESMEKLPRQGTNKNILSSLFRFIYYYCDYLFGQIWIQLKYVRRGYVVIYDRYYFDFINDSRRSNLSLPQPLLQFGYLFIIEPDLNFFLYADADLILSRKKELDKAAIEDLTKSYLSLFDRLGKRSTKCRYIPIENVEIVHTLQQIMGNVLDVAA